MPQAEILPREFDVPQVEDPEELYAKLMEERPKLHGVYDRTTFLRSAACDWGLDPAVLRRLIAHIRPGCRTLETGCGYSTIVFALWSCRHNAVSPFPEEHQCVNEWCRKHGASVETVTYHTGPSQRLLPAMKPTPLDLVIIDGDHSVPTPLIDYYYTADRLVEGGLLFVDDVQLRSVQQLCDFLDTEKQRWQFVEQVARTRIYRKCVEGRVIEGIWWGQQPFCTAPSPPPQPQRGLLYRGLRKIRRTLVG
jgi:predicted O-methyltransferase YrrM